MKMSKLSNQTNSQDPQAVNSRIFVGNLNTFQCSKTDVERMFQIYGRLAGISMHKGYAFVQFTNPFDARNACLGEDGKTVLSQTLDVNMVAEPKPHQIGRKRQNVNKTGNDWEYFYDSYCSSASTRNNSLRPKKRKRLMSNSSRMVTLSEAVNSSNINAAVAAVAAAQQHQQQQQLHHHHHHHHQHHQQQQQQQQHQQQQQQQQQHHHHNHNHHQQQQQQQQVAAVAMAAMANLLPQQQLMLHQQNLLPNGTNGAITTAAVACNGTTTTSHHTSLNMYLQQQQQQHQQQQAAAAVAAAAQYAAVTNGGLQLNMSSHLLNGNSLISNGTQQSQPQQQQQQTTNSLAPVSVSESALTHAYLEQSTTLQTQNANIMQPLSLSLSPQQQQQQHQNQMHLLKHIKQKNQQQQQQTYHLSSMITQNYHQQQQKPQKQLQLQQQHYPSEQLTSNQQWGPFKVYSNPDTLICGNCRECFNELAELLDHKRSYCKLRFTCKCQDAKNPPPPSTPPYGVKLLCAVCKDAFTNPWDLMVHVQASHMVNIYELGNEFNNNNNNHNINNNNTQNINRLSSKSYSNQLSHDCIRSNNIIGSSSTIYKNGNSNNNNINITSNGVIMYDSNEIKCNGSNTEAVITNGNNNDNDNDNNNNESNINDNNNNCKSTDTNIADRCTSNSSSTSPKCNHLQMPFIQDIASFRHPSNSARTNTELMEVGQQLVEQYQQQEQVESIETSNVITISDKLLEISSNINNDSNGKQSCNNSQNNICTDTEINLNTTEVNFGMSHSPIDVKKETNCDHEILSLDERLSLDSQYAVNVQKLSHTNGLLSLSASSSSSLSSSSSSSIVSTCDNSPSAIVDGCDEVSDIQPTISAIAMNTKPVATATPISSTITAVTKMATKTSLSLSSQCACLEACARVANNAEGTVVCSVNAITESTIITTTPSKTITTIAAPTAATTATTMTTTSVTTAITLMPNSLSLKLTNGTMAKPVATLPAPVIATATAAVHLPP